jgi:GT2 family glycosyltransferase
MGGAEAMLDPVRHPGAPGAEPAAAAELTPEDVANAYRLFLGVDPPPVLPADSGSGTAGLLAAILSSERFRSEVLKPVLLSEDLPEERFAGEPAYLLIDWAQRRLPIVKSTAVHCGLAHTWPSLLEALLADPGLAQLASELGHSGITSLLRDRIERDPRFAPGRCIVGAVDSASAFEVRGWAADLCDKSRPVTLQFYADNVFIGSAQCDEFRPDAADVVGGDGGYGFTFRIAAAHRDVFARGSLLTAVDSVLREPIAPGVMIHAEPARSWDALAETQREVARMREALERIEQQLPRMRQIASLPLESYPDYWERFYRPVSQDLAAQRAAAADFEFRPLVSVVIPAYRSQAALLDKALRSVRAQSYERWEVVVSDDASPDASEWRIARRRHADEPRIRWVESAAHGGIARNTNVAVAAAGGDYVAFLDHDDELAPDALYRVVAQLQGERYALLYSDEDRIEDDEFGRCLHHTPFFKPDFDHDLLLAMNYICHLVVVERAALLEVGGLRPGCDGAQDHDLLLRLAARLAPARIRHVARILYHWRVTPGSVSQTPERQEALRRAVAQVVDDHLRACGRDAIVEPHDDPIGRPRLYANRVRWRLPARAPQVSIIVPTRDRRDLLEPCVESILRAASAYPGPTELVVVDNDSSEPATLSYLDGLRSRPGVRLLRHPGRFNWSAINNAAAREAGGSVLIFLNNDTHVLAEDWCAEMVGNALRPEVGAVGARLLYQDGTIQHAGVLVGVEGVAGHEAVGDPVADGGYFGRSHLLRGAAAVTGACLATRRELFEKLGGFDELELKVAFNDIDYCLRVRQAGRRVVYAPHAVLYHFESKSRGRELTAAQQARHRTEALAFRARWGEAVAADPFFNPHFERYARPFDRLRPPPD